MEVRAVTKRNLKLDCGEDGFEANDMVNERVWNGEDDSRVPC